MLFLPTLRERHGRIGGFARLEERPADQRSRSHPHLRRGGRLYLRPGEPLSARAGRRCVPADLPFRSVRVGRDVPEGSSNRGTAPSVPLAATGGTRPMRPGRSRQGRYRRRLNSVTVGRESRRTGYRPTAAAGSYRNDNNTFLRRHPDRPTMTDRRVPGPPCEDPSLSPSVSRPVRRSGPSGPRERVADGRVPGADRVPLDGH